MASKLCRMLAYGEAKAIMKSYDSDHVIKRSHVKLKTSYLLLYKVYTTKLGRVMTYGDRKLPMESHNSLTIQSCEFT